jgi:hypothetical protein
LCSGEPTRERRSEVEIEARSENRRSTSPRRLLTSLAVSSVLLGPFAYLIYDAGVAQSAAAIAGVGLLLAAAIGVAWASQRGGPR